MNHPKNKLILFCCLIFLSNTGFTRPIEQILETIEKGTPESRAKAVQELVELRNNEYIPVILNLLNDPSPEVRISAVLGLKQLKAKETTQKLINSLSDPSVSVCKEIRNVLAEFASREELEKVLLENDKPQVRQQIAKLLGELGNRESVPVLINALKDNDFVRYSAVESLGRTGDYLAIPELEKVLSDVVGEIRLESAKSLARLKSYRSIPKIFDLLEDKDPMVRNEIEPVLLELVAAESVLYFTESVIKDRRPTIRRFSAKALGALNDKSVTPLLFRAVKDSDPTVRKEVVNSLAILVDKTMLFNLCLLLGERDINIRTYAVNTLANLKDSRAIPGLLDMLKRDKEFKETARNTILEICDETITDFLALAIKDKDLSVRLCVVECISKLKAVNLLPELSQAFADENNQEAKLTMLKTIKELNDKKALPGLHRALIEEKSIEIKFAVIDVLKLIGDYTSIPPLLECLRTNNEMLIMEAEELLDNLADIKTLPFFYKAIKDKNVVIRTYAMKVIKKYPVNEGLPVVLEATRDKDIYIRRDAVIIIGSIGDKSAIPVLERTLKDSYDEIRLETVKSLAQIGDPAIVPLIMKSMKDKLSEIRLEAVKVFAVYASEDTVPFLGKRLKKETDPFVIEQIIALLEKYGDRSVTKALLRMLKNDELVVRSASVHALGGLKDPSAIKPLKDQYVSEYSSEVKAQIMKSLAKLGEKEMIPEFIELLHDPMEETRNAARESLDLLIDSSYSSYLVESLHNEHVETRNYCAEKLKEYKSEEIAKKLFSMIKTEKGLIRKELMNLTNDITDGNNIPDFLFLIDVPETNKDAELQIWVLKNLGKFRVKDKNSVAFLLQSTKNENLSVRKESVELLGEVDSLIAKRTLEYIASNDSSLVIRSTAEKVLKRIK